MREPTLLLVDGNNLLFRSFFAMPRLTRTDGFPTGALHGFVSTLRKLLREEAPDYVAVAFDAPGPTFRHELYPEYKANREATPEELARQAPWTREIARVLGCAVLEEAGVEADDVIGALARRGRAEGCRVLIVSGDKDLLQLVDDRTTVILPGDAEVRLDPAGVRNRIGVPPELVPDFLALTGDSVDNVPGVRGIGPKGAVALIDEHGGLEDILGNLDATGPARKRIAALLADQQDQARLSRELVRLRLDLPLPDIPSGPDGLEALRFRDADREAAGRVFAELELRTHAREMAPAAPARPLPSTREATTAAELREALAAARERGRISLHAPAPPGAGSAPPRQCVAPTVLGIASSPDDAVWVEVGSRLPESDVLDALRPVVQEGSDAVAVIGHALGPLVRWLEARGVRVGRVAHDSQISAYLMNTTLRARGFADVLRDFTGLAPPDASEVPKQGLFEPGASGGAEAAVAAAWQFPLAERMDEMLEKGELTGVFADIELPLLPILARMETRGIHIDADALGRLGTELKAEIRALGDRIHELAGSEFDILSTTQLGRILFDRLDLPQTSRTRTGRASTRAGVLEELALQHELPRLVLEYRELAKLKSTWVDPLPRLLDPDTGRLHTTLHQAVAATGRLASSHPNLQNIPIRSEAGRRVRGAFVAAPGRRLVSADYSQIELRVLAHMSGDEALIEAFRSGADIHARTAKEVFGGLPLDPAEARRRAKVINFSIIYGKTAFTLGREIGVPTRDAKTFIDMYFERYRRVGELIERIREEARHAGRVKTVFGRQRHIPEIGAQNRARREAAERMAVNAPVQGTAADVIKIAMIAVERALEPTSGRLLLQVHDELLVEADEGDAEAVGEIVKREMEGVAGLEVPLRADVTISDVWTH